MIGFLCHSYSVISRLSGTFFAFPIGKFQHTQAAPEGSTQMLSGSLSILPSNGSPLHGPCREAGLK